MPTQGGCESPADSQPHSRPSRDGDFLREISIRVVECGSVAIRADAFACLSTLWHPCGSSRRVFSLPRHGCACLFVAAVPPAAATPDDAVPRTAAAVPSSG